jgi:hypothetical protein
MYEPIFILSLIESLSQSFIYAAQQSFLSLGRGQSLASYHLWRDNESGNDRKARQRLDMAE